LIIGGSMIGMRYNYDGLERFLSGKISSGFFCRNRKFVADCLDEREEAEIKENIMNSKA
jgi:hypothetical protein